MAETAPAAPRPAPERARGGPDCPDCGPARSVSRRDAVRLGGLAVVAGLALTLPSARPALAAASPAGREVFPGLVVTPRSGWARDLAPRGALGTEAPGDVRFLLVHHTASSNAYAPEEVTGQLRSFFRFHTGADKGWPDIAYNFLVDRYGGVWEGRAGSLDGPVTPDATGGSQGFAQLACFIGDHGVTPPTEAARASMLRVLAWLGQRYGVDTAPGATTSFVSRGSNRWPSGASVTTATLAGHRDMSLTSCPGDTVYDDLRTRYPVEVTALRAAAAPAVTPPPAPPGPEPSDAPAPSPLPAAPSAAPAPPAATTPPSPAAGPPAAAGAPPGAALGGAPVTAPDGAVADALASPAVRAGLVTATVGAAGAALVWRRSRSVPRDPLGLRRQPREEEDRR